jgi:hypothetical protein
MELANMAKKVFFSFHYERDNWRVSQVRNIGSIEEQPILTSNEWEEVKRKGDKAIEEWINEQMKYKSVVVVLVGSATAGRKWVGYEIKHGWNANKGVLGIYIHNLKDREGNQSSKGRNPFADFKVNGTDMSQIVQCYDPPFSDSTAVYDYIKNNIEDWVDSAIATRSRY